MEKIILGKQYTLDMGQHITVIPRRVLTEGIECDYVMSSPGRKELIMFDIWKMNGFDVSDYSLMWMDTEFDTGSYLDLTSGWTERHLTFTGKMNELGQLLATRVESASFPEVEIEATVDSYVPGTSVTVMGVKIATTGLSFILDNNTLNGETLTETEFYNHLTNNVANIEVKGTLSGMDGTITWNEIELDL